MIAAAGSIGAGQGWSKASRPSSFAGMGHQALLSGFMEELWKARATSCEQDVEEIKRAGMSDKLAGKRKEDQGEEIEKFTF